MTDRPEYAGLAALTICESLLLALNDRNILPEKEIMGILRDAANAQTQAAGLNSDPKAHEGAAKLINKIIAGGNSVRRP